MYHYSQHAAPAPLLSAHLSLITMCQLFTGEAEQGGKLFDLLAVHETHSRLLLTQDQSEKPFLAFKAQLCGQETGLFK